MEDLGQYFCWYLILLLLNTIIVVLRTFLYDYFYFHVNVRLKLFMSYNVGQRDINQLVGWCCTIGTDFIAGSCRSAADATGPADYSNHMFWATVPRRSCHYFIATASQLITLTADVCYWLIIAYASSTLTISYCFF